MLGLLMAQSLTDVVVLRRRSRDITTDHLCRDTDIRLVVAKGVNGLFQDGGSATGGLLTGALAREHVVAWMLPGPPGPVVATLCPFKSPHPHYFVGR